MQKAVRVHAWQSSGFAGLRVDDIEVPTPAADEVLVRWHLQPVQPDDLTALTGQYPVFQMELPAVPGCDGESL